LDEKYNPENVKHRGVKVDVLKPHPKGGGVESSDFPNALENVGQMIPIDFLDGDRAPFAPLFGKSSVAPLILG
jgi:hypothetical protein